MLPPDKEDGRKEPSHDEAAEDRAAGQAEDTPATGSSDASGLTSASGAVDDKDTEEHPRGDVEVSDRVAQTEPAASDVPPGEPVGDPFSPPERAAGVSDDPVEHDDATPRAAAVRAEPAEEGPKQGDPVVDDRTPPPAAMPAERRGGGGFLSALVAAIIGGVIGAAGIWYYLEQQGPVGPDPEMTAALQEQGGLVAQQSARLDEIQGDIDALNDALSSEDLSGAIEQLRMNAEGEFNALGETLAAIGERLDALESDVGAVQGRLGQADQQIAELEARPIADPETATEVLRSEVASMREEVEAATAEARAQVETMRTELADAAAQTQAEVEAAQQRAAELEAQAEERAAAARAEAEAMARAAEARAALAQVELAIDSGEPFADELSLLSQNLDQDVPEPLAAAADSGVPTIASLRESYPDAARSALRATAVATTEGEPGDRFMAFLRTQTQARSLTPQQGDEPDAILSRAEAALEEGNVGTALAELEALPEDGRAAMQDWLEQARLRADAANAADSLSQGMN